MPGASPKLARVLAVDLFNCWAAPMMGLGFAVASKWELWKGTPSASSCTSIVGAFLIWCLPGLAEGMGGAGGPIGGL